MSRGILATLDLHALKHNFLYIKEHVSPARVLVMIKSNAYGHGLLPISKALPCADAFGVSSVEEGITLRLAGITIPVVVMTGFFDENELSLCVQYHLQGVVHHELQLALLEKSQLPAPLSVWFKIDTGMHRLGFSIKDTPVMYQRLLSCNAVKQPMTWMTHLADADHDDQTFSRQQIELFSQVTQCMSAPKSILNSAGLLSFPEACLDWVRPGVMLYGASPLKHQDGPAIGLKPVMTLSAKLIAIKDCVTGDRIGYGGTWICPESMRIGIVAMGYGDGYPRHVKNGTPTLLDGVICPLVGRVSMDMLAIDLRAVSLPKLGDRVILWGVGLPIEQIAQSGDTIPHTLFSQVSQRVQMETINE